ncbi:MAG: DUF1592 domain-containing protein, partial [Planctomycetaceae bacterium]
MTSKPHRTILPMACLLWFSMLSTTVMAQSLDDARAEGLKRSTFLNRTTQPKQTTVPVADLQSFRSDIQPILRAACVDCHGPDTQEGNIRIDTLDPNLLGGKDVDWWLEVQAVLTKGEMPPADADELADADRSKVINWLANEIQVASIARRASGEHTSFRRMTRYEFNHALQDLLGLPYNFAKDLPPEAHSDDGFQNSSDLLHMSVSQLESYHQLARTALNRATVRGEQPDVLHWNIPMEDVSRIDWANQQAEIKKAEAADKDNPSKLEELETRFQKKHTVPYFKDIKSGRTVKATWAYHRAKYALTPTATPRYVPAELDQYAVLPRGRHRFTIELGNRVPDEGTMRVRVRASRVSADGEDVPSLQLLFGWQASNEGRAVLPVAKEDTPITATADAPEFYEWNLPLGEIYPRNSVRKTSKMGAMPNPSEYIRLVNSSVSQGPIRIAYVEIAAPVYDEWPPVSHKTIFFDSNARDDESAYARLVLDRFINRAWRRPIVETELDQKMKLFTVMREQCDSFEEAMVEVLATVLASPQFLYVSNPQANADGSQLPAHELATRLSMFLWCSVPDAELRQLADSGRLMEPSVLAQQVTRMLADERSHRFSDHFVHQWLDMQLLDFLTVKRGLAPLKQAMQREPVELFAEVLRTDSSVLDFVHANYTMANERLARHYRLSNVKGNHFRRVQLNATNQRGGLLTQAGLLAMNSAGDDSHPLKRGVWLLESLLNDPPPPPPPAVPEIDLADPRIA